MPKKYKNKWLKRKQKCLKKWMKKVKTKTKQMHINIECNNVVQLLCGAQSK